MLWKNLMERAISSGWKRRRCIFTQTHTYIILFAGELQGFQNIPGVTSPQDSRKGVSLESLTHPHTIPFPGFSDWSLLE